MIKTTFQTSTNWSILNSVEQSVKSKIELAGIPLSKWDIKINRGILTGLNEAFIVDKKKRDELVARDPKSAEIIRPILRGKDIKRYDYSFAEQYVILTIFNSHKHLEADYPAIYKHLYQFKEKLEKRGQCRYTSSGKVLNSSDPKYPGYPGMHHWLELDNNPRQSYLDDFNRQKIMFQEMVQEPSFILDNKGFVCLDTARIITGDDLDLLIAVLNSKLFFYAIKTFYGGGSLGDKGIRMKHTFFNQFPCIHFSEEIAPIVKRLVSELSIGDHANIEKLKTIDNLVYKAYGLSEDERNFIESQ